jgi:cytochrome c nitrite reductase small subunit
LKLLLVVLTGIVAGLTGFTAWYAKGHSYLSDDPEACINCHIMNEQFDAWSRASHKAVATCNDCHTPDDFVGKWTTKAINGFNHSVAFTFDTYPDPIVINRRNARITRESCLACHGSFVAEIAPFHPDYGALDCIHCHRTVGHGP